MFSDFATHQEFVDQVFEGLGLTEQEVNSKRFYDCRFVDCVFNETLFRKCRFRGCTFERCDLQLVRFPDSSFSDTQFEQSSLAGVNWTEAQWPRKGFLCPIGFIECRISHSTFIGLSLKEIVIRDCVARNVDFRETNLTRADLRGTDFEESLFIHTDLTEADFTGAKNYTINASVNRLEGAKFALPEAMALLYGLDIVLIE